MITEDQMPSRFRDVIDEQIAIFDDGRSIQVRNTIPDTTEIPIENPKHWLRIPDAICVYVDMLGSTRLSAESYDQSTAGAYQLFTGTAVRLFSAFEAPYIDVRGDGAFALFDSNQPYRALAAAVTFKTFAKYEFVGKIRDLTDVDVGCHIGIDQRTVLVRKLGFKRYRGRSDRQNEVWAGKPVNMAAKLASLSKNDQLIASDRYFSNLKDEHALLTCGCPGGEKVDLWTPLDLCEYDRFDFDTAYVLEHSWCKTHGKEYCEIILRLDED